MCCLNRPLVTKGFTKCLGMFSRLSRFVVEHNLDLDDALISLISSHLQTLKGEFTRYLPDISKPKFELIRNPLLLN